MGRLQLRIAQLRDNLGDATPNRMREAGLDNVEELTHRSSPVGRVTFYRAAVASQGTRSDLVDEA